MFVGAKQEIPWSSKGCAHVAVPPVPGGCVFRSPGCRVFASIEGLGQESPVAHESAEGPMVHSRGHSRSVCGKE